tara:strand:+ start:79 stop:252 length:174 start_codon:yes stop_codon:yes gene_type:complete
MTYYEALIKTDKLNLKLHAGNDNGTDTGHASIERILPESIDPAKEGDKGWDVLVTMD